MKDGTYTCYVIEHWQPPSTAPELFKNPPKEGWYRSNLLYLMPDMHRVLWAASKDMQQCWAATGITGFFSEKQVNRVLAALRQRDRNGQFRLLVVEIQQTTSVVPT